MTLADLTTEQVAYCSPAALRQDLDGFRWLTLDAECAAEEAGEATLRVARNPDGFDVDRSRCRDHAIAVIDRPYPGLSQAFDHTPEPGPEPEQE